MSAHQHISAIQAVHEAFGAPGDYGYETKQGKALYALYRLNIPRVLEEVAAKRLCQIALGYDAAHDDEHAFGEIGRMAAAYVARATGDFYPSDLVWPWTEPMAESKGVRNDLLVAAALIIADIERIDRQDARS